MAANKTAVPAKKTVAAKSILSKVRLRQGNCTEDTKTQVIRKPAKQMEVALKQVGAFFDLLIETATTQTRKAGEFTIPGLGKLCKAQRATLRTIKRK